MSEVRIVDPVTGGEKGQKPERFDLIPWDAMEEVARVYAAGAAKYSDRNWERGYAWSLSVAALFRHVVRWMLGEDFDSGPKGTGCHHLACATFHALALLTFHFRGLGTDDRKPSVVTAGAIPVYGRTGTVIPRNSFFDDCEVVK